MPQPYLHDLLCLVRAPACALSRPDGQIEAGGGHGVFVADTRVLSRIRLLLDGAEPAPLSHADTDAGTARFVATARHRDDPHVGPTMWVTRTRTVHAAGLRERYDLVSHASGRVRVRLRLDVACDLAGIADVKAGRPVPARSPTVRDAVLTFGGADGTRVRVTLTPVPGAATAAAGTGPAPDADGAGAGVGAGMVVRADADGFEAEVDLPPGRSMSLVLLCTATVPGALFAAPPAEPAWPAPVIEPADCPLARLVGRGLADLDALRMSEPDGSAQFAAAGAPWYLTLFGRDSLWAARMLLPLGTALAGGTLRALARRQGRAHRPDTGEQPGKIIHEVRRASASHSPTPDGRPLRLPAEYYGSIDATALWILLLHDAWCWGLPERQVADLLDPLARALEWLATDAVDARGLVVHRDPGGQGLVNQGWKDSYDAIRFGCGAFASPPLALVEVQGYAHEAARAGAALLDAFGREGGDRYRDLADQLAAAFRAHFWVHGALGPYPAVALDGDGRPVDSLTSNIGHLLGTGLLRPDEEAAVGRLLRHPDLDSGYGLRTLAASATSYNPLSYHRGSVWAHDTAIAVTGLARSGADATALASLAGGLLAAAEHVDYQLPELIGGQPHADGPPVPYPTACHPQAWAAAAGIAVLAATAGIAVDGPGGPVRVDPPATLRGLGGIRAVRGLRVNGRAIDLDLSTGAGRDAGARHETTVGPVS